MNFFNAENLKVTYQDGTVALCGANLSIKKGESLGLIGESGSGKTTFLLAAMGLLFQKASIQGNIFYKKKNLQSLSQDQRQTIQWKEIALVFQNTHRVLNPRLTVKQQIEEAMKRHLILEKKEREDHLESLFEKVQLNKKWMHVYPQSLSGGMLQKILIIMALSCKPSLLLVDEPTTALESISKNRIIDLFTRLRREENLSMIVVSHDLKAIQALTDRSVVLYRGHMLERNFTSSLLYTPRHPYTRALVNASSDINPYKDLWGIEKLTNETKSGCPYYDSCTQRVSGCLDFTPFLSENETVSCFRGGIVKLVEATDVEKTYKLKNGEVKACDNCYLDVNHGEVVSIVGQSGSGKTTLAKIISGIVTPDKGCVVCKQGEIPLKMNELNGIQIVLQDPFSAINLKMTIEKVILEPLEVNQIYDKNKRKEEAQEALFAVGLENIELHRKCKHLSGGQLQRVAVARALVMKPKLLIADEMTSMLDTSNKVNLLRLLKSLQNKKGFSMIYVTHELRLAQKISDRIFVMKDGRVIESGNAHYVLKNPQHSYTKQLAQSLLETF